MKKSIKGIVLNMMFLASSVAYAGNEFICKHTNASLQFKGGIYEVSHWGNSRNSYLAKYKEVGRWATRFGGYIQLEKVEDQSTWKDMPASLTLNYHDAAGADFWVLSGLKIGTVWFERSDCTETNKSVSHLVDGSNNCGIGTNGHSCK